jgi:hypothetical protein
VNNQKQINKNWQEFLAEAKYDFKPGRSRAETEADPVNKLPRHLATTIRNHAEYFAQSMIEDKDVKQMAAFATAVRATGIKAKSEQMYYVFFKDDDTYLDPFDQDALTQTGNGYYAWRESLPSDPPESSAALGDAFEKEVVMNLERSLGQELTITWFSDKFPSLFSSLKNDPEFLEPFDTDNDETLSDDELNQISLDDIPALEPLIPDLSDFDFDPNPLPVVAEPADEPEQTPEPESEPEYEPDDQDKVVAGINSDVYPDSLMNILKPIDFLTKDEKGQLLLLMLKATEEDDVVLEAIGDSDRGPRTFSPNTTKELNDLIAKFGLEPQNQKKLERTIQKWARMNTVKFSAPPKERDVEPERPPEAPVDDETQPEDEESGIVDKAMDTVKQKAQDLGVEMPDVEQVKLALDAISFAGVTGAGEIVATPATIASLALNIATKDWDDALIDVVSLLPVAGKAFRLSAKTAKTAKAAKTLATAADVSARAGKIADVVKKGKAAKNVAKNLGAILGSRLDKGELQQVAKIRDFITKLSDSGVFGDAPSELSEPFLDMMAAANKAQRDKNNVTESLDRLQTLAGINKRIL